MQSLDFEKQEGYLLSPSENLVLSNSALSRNQP